MGNGAAFLARTKKSSDSTQHLGNYFESGVASKIRHLRLTYVGTFIRCFESGLCKIL